MRKTVLTDAYSSLQPEMGEYCGVETALTFGDARGELDALRSGCGIYDLGWRSKIAVTGQDRMRWLNGMITNNIRDLKPGWGNYSFVLTPQGRIQGDLYAYNRGEYLMLGSERSQTQTLLDRLKKYIIMDKVEIEDVSDQLSAIGVQGPKAWEIITSAGLDAPSVAPMEVKDFSWNGIGLSISRMASEKFLTYELWASSENAAQLWAALANAGGRPTGMDALEMFRIAAGIPRYGLDMRERDVPQETGQDQALNFSKGCYIGQEIVERIRARGNVHRTLAGLVVDGAVPAHGTKLAFEGKEVGEITSARAVPCRTADAARVLALGIIRREATKPGTRLDAGGVTATVTEIPFPEAIS